MEASTIFPDVAIAVDPPDPSPDAASQPLRAADGGAAEAPLGAGFKRPVTGDDDTVFRGVAVFVVDEMADVETEHREQAAARTLGGNFRCLFRESLHIGNIHLDFRPHPFGRDFGRNDSR